MSKGNVTVLGINGHIGHHAAQAFQHAGFSVTGFGRTNRHPIAGIKFIQGDAASLDDIKAAITDADIVVNALNLPYDKWDKGRAEAQLATVIAAMGDSGKTLMFPGNIYNYSASDRRISPSTPQRPQTPRGAIRVRQEEMLAAASKAGKFQTIIIRAGDFYAPNNTGDWYDQAMMMEARKGKIYHMADLKLGHAWAYLPDLGRAFAVLGEKRGEFGSFENFHFSGHYVTHGALMDAVVKASPVPLKVAPLPWIFLQAMGLANGVLREVVKMRYLWNSAMELVDPRLDSILGPDFGTPFEVAVAATVQPFLAQKAAA
ncbi:NAD-dependent epimerase/dehydratase family protein [Devosia sp. SL43]|uniref:NAD-dependent epimerase/dehydratase family protein n=1 Tax=Devosia sp. SL43 TaxID=2806348 RepID=UPI001F01A820|nr:NAD-dependent epimerase/dehydratase family protein [Devosia sp. SL43]UJW84016.1 NAD-dependent epimerase/dehydratase family protein [Devosia sp. SL43]